jgi:superfamily II DNA/RNA helicase
LLFVLFPQVIPETLAQSRQPSVCVRDVCVGAATGSGKTLVFVLTVLQALRSRGVARLRALVVLPSRHLAMQVQ